MSGGATIADLGQFPIDGFVGLAPMVQALRLPTEGMTAMTYRAAARFMKSIGLGKAYAYGQGRFDGNLDIQPDNPLTHDLHSLSEALADWGPDSPLVTDGVTYSWVNAYYKNVDRIAAIPDGSIDIPGHLITASQDAYVCNKATRRAARIFKKGEVSEIDARHALPLGGPKVLETIVGHIERMAETAPLRHRTALAKMALN
jgi:alpha-beta hydrolase superfamily lysophospholipase